MPHYRFPGNLKNKPTSRTNKWIQQGHKMSDKHSKNQLYFYIVAMIIWAPK